MNLYLQRLYDAAGGTVAAVEARPAQRSSSPLLAVDQRLASPAYAASFLLGLPGSADPDASPAPEPDLLTLPAPGRRDPTPAPDQEPVRVPAPRPVPPATPRHQDQQRVVASPTPSPVAEPEPVRRPPASPHETVAAPTPAAPTDVAPVPAPVRVETRPVVERVVRHEPPDPVVAEPQTVLRAEAPSGRMPTAQPRPDPPHPSAPARARRPAATAPPMVRPAPAAVIDPLPPPPLPRAVEPTDLDVQVRRLVREAMAGEGAPRRTSRDRQEGAVAEPVPSASPARTAEAMSVIGSLDRPARATTLYGLRLR